MFVIYNDLTSPYMRLVRSGDGAIVASATGALSKTTAWAASAITLTKSDTIGGIPIVMPSGVPAGDYDLLVYDNSTPADTDLPELGKRIAWSGSHMIGLPLSL